MVPELAASILPYLVRNANIWLSEPETLGTGATSCILTRSLSDYDEG